MENGRRIILIMMLAMFVAGAALIQLQVMLNLPMIIDPIFYYGVALLGIAANRLSNQNWVLVASMLIFANTPYGIWIMLAGLLIYFGLLYLWRSNSKGYSRITKR